MLRNLILPVIGSVFALFGSAGATNDTVRVEGGLIPVSVVDEVRIYKGIPFAAAFLGGLRDSPFALPMRAWARMTATGRSKAYLYFFSHVPPNPNSKYLSSYHAGEIVYVFNNLNRQNTLLQEADYKLAEMMSNYLVNFATVGEVRQVMEKRGGVGVAGPPPAPGA